MMATIDGQAVLKGRRDLVWQAQPAGWSVYDPLTRSGYRCGRTERWLFEQFDGARSLSSIHRSALEQDDLPSISWPELVALAETLARRGLVHCRNHSGDWCDSSVRASTRTWLQWFSQSVSWRLRGVDPQRFLQWLAPHTDCFFSRTAVQCWLGVMAITALCGLADFQRLTDQADLWQWLIKPASGSALFAIFVVTRAIHELGHALVLTRFGGRSPDIGVIFMLGAPCVYCDVTESWRLPHAWQRAAVAAGGMWAESIVATIAALLWLITADGLINTLALQTMVVCSISTWLVNANPLMRFDGYYLLSDWWDEPNLRQRADECAMRLVKRLVLGQRQRKSPANHWPREAALCMFSIFGVAYRLSLSWMMAAVIVAMYATWHFESVGKCLAVLLLGCWWGVPAMRFIGQLIRSAHTVWAKARLSLLAAGVVLMICIVPIPGREHGRGWVQPARMQGLYAPQSARLEAVLKHAGTRVDEGETIVQLDDATAQLRRIDLDRHAEQARIHWGALVDQVKRNSPIDADLVSAENAASALANQARHAESNVKKLSIQSRLAGKLVSLPAPKLQDIDGHVVDSTPALWLDRNQCGRMVPQGTMLGAICSRQQLAVIPLNYAQLSQVGQGTALRFYMPSHSNRVWAATVQSIVKLDQLDTLARLVATSTAGAEPVGQASAEISNAGYAAIVELPMQDAVVGAEVRAVFTVSAKTLAVRINDWAHHNLRWLIP